MQHRNRRDFTRGSIPRHLIIFAIPMFLGNLLQALYNTVDSIWVGRFVGHEALAAVSISFPVIFALVALVMGIAMATTTLVAQYAGAGDSTMVRRTVGNSLTLLALTGSAAAVIGFVYRVPLLQLINTPPEVLDMASSYLGIFLAGLPLMFIYNATSGVLRGLGDSRTPLVFLAYAVVTNMALDPLFILGLGPLPAMGVRGAALATVLSQGVASILSLQFLLRSRDLLRLDRSLLRLDRRLTRLTLIIGLPAGLQQTLVSLSMLAVNSIVNTFGAAVVAGYGAGLRLDQFAFMPAMTLGLAVTALVGQNLGAGKQERVSATVRFGVLITTAIAIAVGLLVVVFARPLLTMFTTDPRVVEVGRGYLLFAAPAFVPFGLMFVLSGVLRGAGDTVPAMLITVASLWLVRVPLAATLARTAMDERGIWLAIALSPVIGTALNYGYYLSGRWKNRVVTNRGPASATGEPGK